MIRTALNQRFGARCANSPMRAVLLLVAIGSSLLAQTEPQSSAIPKFGTTVVIPLGLEGKVYKIHHWTTRLPDFSKLKPLGSIYTSALNVPPQRFNQGFPGVTHRFEWFAIDYRGRIWISRSGMYRFQLTADDGARLYMDDQLIVDNDGAHPPETREGSLKLETGIHRIRLSYFQGPRFLVALVLKAAGPDDPSFRVFSTNDFKPPPQALETFEK
jgi:PA14 domain